MFPLWSAGDNCSYSFFVVGPEQIQVEELLVDLRALLTRVDLQLILGRICCKVRMSNASTTNGYGGGGTDPISRGGNCQKVAAHILHPPVDLITVNNNMVNSIGRVPIGTFSSLAFFFFPSIKHSSALTLILLWSLALCSCSWIVLEKNVPCLVKFYIIGHDLVWSIWSILTLFAPLEHAHHVLHFTPDVYHCILSSSSAFLFILFNSQEITMPINEHRIFTVFENPIKSLITNFGKWLIQTEGILVLCWYKKKKKLLVIFQSSCGRSVWSFYT